MSRTTALPAAWGFRAVLLAVILGILLSAAPQVVANGLVHLPIVGPSEYVYDAPAPPSATSTTPITNAAVGATRGSPGSASGIRTDIFLGRSLPAAEGELGAVTSGDDLTVAHLDQPDLIGSAGRGPDVRELAGDAQNTFDSLVSEGNGVETPHPTYQGDRYTLDDGTVIGLRNSTRCGPTIDVNPSGPTPAYRIHFVP